MLVYMNNMAARRSILWFTNSTFTAPRQLSATRSVRTSAVSLKKTPHTVGVPAWAKAAQRRRRSLVKLDKPKTLEQIESEDRLSSNSVMLDFFTSTRNKRPLSKTQEDSDNISHFSMTKDNQAFVCYHPSVHNPKSLLLSKEASERPWWYLTTDEVNKYKDNLETEEIEEAKQLRKKDPKIWTVNALSRLFKVKPLSIVLNAPLTKEQKYELEVERRLVNQWSDFKRKEYRAHQELERQRYILQTRGQDMYKALGMKS